jgi:chromosome segregation ATPase
MAAAGDLPAVLSKLELSVHDAAARLRELRATNERLGRRVRELEEQLAGSSAGDGGAGAAWAAERAAWEAERAEVRSRLEALARRLEELGES